MLTGRRLVTVAITALVVLALTVKFYRNPFDPLDSGRWPVHDEYHQETQDSIRSRFGPPSREWQGYYGCPPLDYANEHTPSTTMTYLRSTGTLYLSFEPWNGEWVCYTSHWMPNGWVF